MANMSLVDIRNKILSGAIDVNGLSETLKDLRLYAYSYLYNLQKDMVNICKIQAEYDDFAIKVDDVFTHNYLNRYREFNVKIPFIHHNHRLKFRRSEFYNVPITNKDVEDHRDLFIYSFFVFVDGYLDKSAKICCREELTSICLRKEEMNPELQKHFKPGCKIDILFLPDVRSENISSTKLDFAAAGNKFTTTAKLKSNDEIIIFISKGKELPRMFEAKIENEYVVIPEKAFEKYSDDDEVDITAVIIPNILENVDCPVGTDFFEPINRPMPITENNILIFKENTDGSITLNCGAKVEKKYPNIFELENNHMDHYHAHVYYWDNYSNRDMKYDNDLHPYRSFIDILTAYANGTINISIASYIPYLYSYEVKDYHNLNYKDMNSESLMYKANKLFDVYKLWAYAAQLYHEKRREDINSYLIYTENVDMTSKLRMDNHRDVSDTTEWDEFDEPMYLFVFSNRDPVNRLPYKFWINGLRFIPNKYYLDKSYEYVYFPVSQVPENAVIEIERSSSIEFIIDIFSTNADQLIDLSVLRNNSVPFKSFYVTDKEGYYISPDVLHFSVDIDGVVYDVPEGSLMLINKNTKLFIRTDIDIDVRIRVSDRPIETNRVMDLTNWSEENLNAEGYIRNIPNYPNRLRIFQNGRLVPHGVTKIELPQDSNEPVKAWFDYPGYGIYGTFQLDYIPEGYNLVYSMDRIGDKGVIDLTGRIDKPFSLKYYDIYINGYRILPNQFERISNFVIRLKNIETLNILEIYEKDVAPDEVYVMEADDAKNFLSDALYNNDEEFRNKLLDWIETIIPDNTIVDADKLHEILEFVVNSVIDYLEINQLFSSNEIEEKFFNKYRPFFNDDVFYIDANITYKNGYATDSDKIFYLAPQKHNEIEGINSPSYVEQLSQIMEVIGLQFINSNEERPEIPDKYPKLKLRDNDDEVILITGDKIVSRFDTETKLISPTK